MVSAAGRVAHLLEGAPRADAGGAVRPREGGVQRGLPLRSRKVVDPNSITTDGTWREGVGVAGGRALPLAVPEAEDIGRAVLGGQGTQVNSLR